MSTLLSHRAIEQTMFKLTSLNEYVMIAELKYLNMWRRRIKSNLYAESGIDKLQEVEVYQQKRNTWTRLHSTTERKTSERGYFQKNIISWIVTFCPNEEKIFRLVLMKKKSPVPCMLTGGLCKKDIEPSLHKVFIGYASKPKHFKKGIFKNKIKEILESFGFEALLWEDRTQTGHFDCKICLDIQESFFTIFEFSEKNLNIAFEFGFALGINKAYFILKKRKGEDLPADVRDLDHIEYGSYKGLASKLKQRIKDRYTKILGLSSAN